MLVVERAKPSVHRAIRVPVVIRPQTTCRQERTLFKGLTAGFGGKTSKGRARDYFTASSGMLTEPIAPDAASRRITRKRATFAARGMLRTIPRPFASALR